MFYYNKQMFETKIVIGYHIVCNKNINIMIMNILIQTAKI